MGRCMLVLDLLFAQKRIHMEHGIHHVINSALFSVAFTSRNYTSILPYNIMMSTWTDSPNGHVVN